MTEPRTILGIDPGTNLLGFGVVRVEADGKPRFVDMGVLDLRRIGDPYTKLLCIHEKVSALCDLYHPDDLAIESPFYAKNAQVPFKLGRAQGSAMVAAVAHGVTVVEYAPRKAKMAICGNGAASKEQVALIVEKTLGIDILSKYLDATDALALAMCHYYTLASPIPAASAKKTTRKASQSWEQFVQENPDRIKK